MAMLHVFHPRNPLCFKLHDCTLGAALLVLIRNSPIIKNQGVLILAHHGTIPVVEKSRVRLRLGEQRHNMQKVEVL